MEFLWNGESRNGFSDLGMNFKINKIWKSFQSISDDLDLLNESFVKLLTQNFILVSFLYFKQKSWTSLVRLLVSFILLLSRWNRFESAVLANFQL